MAKENAVAPKERISVTYKPATGGNIEETELPLKLMVLADFTQRYDERRIEDRNPISIDKYNFDEVLAKQEIQLNIAVPNRLENESSIDELPVHLHIKSMEDFHPDQIVDQVPELKKLMELRNALVSLKGPLGNAPAFRKAIENALQNPDARARVLDELGLASQPQTDA